MTAPTLSEALSQYGNQAYLITVGSTVPHTSNVLIKLRGNNIDCVVGPNAAKNITTNPHVSSFWLPHELAAMQ
jgi:hypothetical protein